MTDQEYLNALDSMFGGPDESDIRNRTTRIVRTNKTHGCQCQDMEHEQHLIPAGNRAVLDKAMVDGKWAHCYVCLPCLKSWHAHCETGAEWCTVVASAPKEGE